MVIAVRAAQRGTNLEAVYSPPGNPVKQPGSLNWLPLCQEDVLRLEECRGLRDGTAARKALLRAGQTLMAKRHNPSGGDRRLYEAGTLQMSFRSDLRCDRQATAVERRPGCGGTLSVHKDSQPFVFISILSWSY